MGFDGDAEQIEAVMRDRDPAFSAVPPPVLHRAIKEVWAAVDCDRNGFLLAAMRAVAVAGNAHSRVIPNGAISVLPRRVVVRDGVMAMVVDGTTRPILAVNGVPVPTLLRSFAPYLAGNAARQRVLSGIMLVWPAALAAAGVHGPSYAFTLDGGPDQVCDANALVPASTLYPISDTGGFGEPSEPPIALSVVDGVCRVRLADLKALRDDDLAAGVAALRPHTQAGLVVDLRGNPGGSFLKAVPLVDWIGTAWRGRTCVILVNGYTFSAAIVVAVLLAHRLGPRARLMGSDMGDTLAFWAEGDMLDLNATGAALRYSTGWHDWVTGIPDATTPPEIAAHMIGAGALQIEPVPHQSQARRALEVAKTG